ncbi:RE1 [Symbiodinium microadriaticum]|nr:RE1 [Symbiodinium microadriaticum]
MALLDSGASHAYRAPRTVEETKTAKRVRVQLADGRAVYLRQNPGGTLLSEGEGGGTILPLGSLVESLGCRLEWTRRHGLRVHHPRYGLLPTKLIGNTPVLREAEALQLIADMEQVEMDKLEANVTEGAIRTLSVDDAPATWLHHLEEFINKGERACLRRMLLDEESPVKALSEQEVVSLLGVEERLLLSDDAGAHYLKALPVNRAMRKRLMRTRWVVHLYNGDEQGPEFARAESDDVTVIRMDMKDSKAYDLRFANGAVRALMWAAARGQIEAVLGAPPRGSEHSSLLFKRMMLLWLVANSGAAINALCAPSFTLELPTWHHFWTSSAWLSFRDELRFLKYHSVACQGNLYFLASSLEMSDGLDVDEARIPTLNYATPASSWPSTFKVALAQALLNWRRSDMRRHEAVLSKLIGNRELNAKDLEYWQRCLTPSAYSLSLDIDIPFPDEEEEESEPELDPFEEDEGAMVPNEEEDDEQKEMNKRFQKIYEGIGDNIEYQTLHFAVPMNTRTSKEVRSKIQQIYLQLRQHGLPLVRIHSDRGLELKAKETRAWMADRDILATTGESQQPQQNGRAEALVRTIKRRVKALLRSASLPMSCWPSAAEFAARRQRDLALGNYEDKDLPYGAPTHVKYKRFGEGGRYDLLERWKEGTFVGYSNDVARGKVVRHSDGSYTTSVHIRPYLIDVDDLVEFGPHEVEVPVPERRVRGKASVAQLLQEPINDLDRAAKKRMDEGKYDSETVVELWEMLRSRARRTTRNSQGEGLQWMVGQYTHGGQCGVVNDTNAYPFVTLYLVKAFKELTGIHDFTSLLITEDVGMKCHRDVHNYVGRSNMTSSMKQPTYEILRDYGFEPPPLPPQVPEHLQQAVLRMLSVDPVKDPDINEAVLFLVKEAEGERRQRTQQISEELQQLQEDVLGRLKERREWLQEFLAEEEILAEEIGVVGESINEEIMGINDVVRDLIHDVETQVTEVEKKCEGLYLRVANVDDDKEIGDIEEYLANLKKDLEVTLDVPLDQEKTGAIERWSIGEARKLESEGRLILIPGKVVCTVKPPAPLGPGSPPSTTPRWKRKARVVICGNLAGQSYDPNDLFAAGASVEGLRLALAIAVSMGWCVASTDVSVAFLQAKWPQDRPTYGVLPPKILQQAKLVESGVVFIVRRALYGLRESPALWAAHRTQVLEELSVETKEGRIFLKQMTTDSELWMILLEPTKGARPILRGILVTYVDDLLYLAARDVILNLHEKIGSIWPCSGLEFGTEGLRYLGMELIQNDSTVTLSQAGLPCPKEWLQDEDFNDVTENFDDEELKRAQKVIGECLWLAYRTRPDILFVTNYMAAMTSRKPVKVYNVGLKVIAYLNSTSTLKLRVAATAEQQPTEPTQSTKPTQSPEALQPRGHEVGGQELSNHVAGFTVPLAGFCDASFAPYGGKSYGCSMTVLGQTPVAWKAGKQPLVAMSVCEAELLEGSNCALLLESTMSMVRELLPESLPPKMYIDNQAAGNILNGSVGSWRTRHLRIRHSYVLDRVKAGCLSVEYIAGEDQPADLPTKMHSKEESVIGEPGPKIYFVDDTANTADNYEAPADNHYIYDYHAAIYYTTPTGADRNEAYRTAGTYDSSDERKWFKNERVWAAATYDTSPTGESDTSACFQAINFRKLLKSSLADLAVSQHPHPEDLGSQLLRKETLPLERSRPAITSLRAATDATCCRSKEEIPVREVFLEMAEMAVSRFEVRPVADIRVCRDTRFFMVTPLPKLQHRRTGLPQISAGCQSQRMIHGPAEVSLVAEDVFVTLGSEHGTCKALFQVRQDKGDSALLECNGKVLDGSAARDITAVHGAAVQDQVRQLSLVAMDAARSAEKRQRHWLWRRFPCDKTSIAFKIMVTLADLSSVVCIIIGWVWGFIYKQASVPIQRVGDLSSVSFQFFVRGLSTESLGHLAFPSAMIAVVGFLGSVAGSKPANEHRYRYDSNEELVALGLANIAGATMAGFPITGAIELRNAALSPIVIQGGLAATDFRLAPAANFSTKSMTVAGPGEQGVAGFGQGREESAASGRVKRHPGIRSNRLSRSTLNMRHGRTDVEGHGFHRWRSFCMDASGNISFKETSQSAEDQGSRASEVPDCAEGAKGTGN